MTKKYTFTVTKDLVGLRLDVACKTLFPKFSRNEWKNFGKFVCENIEKPNKIRLKLDEKWEVTCEPPLENPEQIVAWDFPLDILQETNDWVVINKPINVTVHPSASDKTANNTIMNALIHHFGQENLSENFDEINDVKIPRLGIVHRLDKTTSGVLLIAKNNKTHRIIQENWQDTAKIYYALVHGKTTKKGDIKSGISRDLQNRKKMAVTNVETGKFAHTQFELIKSFKHHSLLKIKILTGRTHQIRVHLSSIGHAILGDTLYGGEASKRIFLHAETLSFPNPNNLIEKITVKAEIPREFETILNC